MKKIQIAVTFWNRFPERFACLKRTYHAIEKYTDFGDYGHEWIISCETDRCLNKKQVNDFLKPLPNVKYYWKDGAAALASNLNNVLKACDAPLILYLQDDFLLVREFSIYKYADFLLNSEYDMIRYNLASAFRQLKGEGHLKLIDDCLQLFEISHKAINVYSDQPHLKKLSFHKKYGYFPDSTYRGYDSGDCEIFFNKRIKKSKAKILIAHSKEMLHNESDITHEERWRNWWENEAIRGLGAPSFLHIKENQSTLKEKWEHWWVNENKKRKKK